MPQCQICQNKKTKFFNKINKYSYYFCPRCITLFLYPKPTARQINRYYSKSFEYSAGQINEARIRSRASTILKHLKQLNPAAKTLLDIGSGYGYFLDEAKKYNLKTIGIEPAKHLASLSMNRYIDTVYNLTFDQFFKRHKRKQFDFITVIHTIEHLTNPRETIQKAVKLLNKGGILFLETPNLDSHLFYSEKYNYTFLTPPDHIWLFSQRSFYYLLKKIRGIQIEKISTYSYPEHFMGIIKNLLNRQSKDYHGLIADSHRYPRESATNQRKSSLQQKTNYIKHFKYLLFDKLIAPLLTPFLNLGIKGSILELYIRKK